MVVALILLLGMGIPIALILMAVGTDMFVVLWMGITGANDAWKKRVHPWFSAHVIHRHPTVIAHR